MDRTRHFISIRTSTPFIDSREKETRGSRRRIFDNQIKRSALIFSLFAAFERYRLYNRALSLPFGTRRQKERYWDKVRKSSDALTRDTISRPEPKISIYTYAWSSLLITSSERQKREPKREREKNAYVCNRLKQKVREEKSDRGFPVARS